MTARPVSRMARAAVGSTGGPTRAPATGTQKQRAGRSATGEAGASAVVLRRPGVGCGAAGASAAEGARAGATAAVRAYPTLHVAFFPCLDFFFTCIVSRKL
jgi:hypothetical protein